MSSSGKLLIKRYLPEEVESIFQFKVPVQVRYSDIDPYMHVNNGIYFNYLEHARALYLHKVCEWDVLKTGTVVANINIDFFVPIYVLDKPSVYLRCTEVRKSSFDLEQVLMGETEKNERKVFARAMTTMVSVDMQTLKPVPVHEQYVLKLTASPSQKA